jgi:hypothetical protein
MFWYDYNNLTWDQDNDNAPVHTYPLIHKTNQNTGTYTSVKSHTC